MNLRITFVVHCGDCGKAIGNGMAVADSRDSDTVTDAMHTTAEAMRHTDAGRWRIGDAHQCAGTKAARVALRCIQGGGT